MYTEYIYLYIHILYILVLSCSKKFIDNMDLKRHINWFKSQKFDINNGLFFRAKSSNL